MKFIRADKSRGAAAPLFVCKGNQMANGKNGKGKLIVFGIIFWYPLAGVTYQFLHYLIGLRRLGWDVYYVEDSSRWVFDVRDFELTPDASRNIEMVAPVLQRYGFSGKWVFRGG